MLLSYRPRTAEGLAESILLAVGTQHLRIGVIDGDTSAVAARIRQAWGLNDKNIGREGERFVTIRLPCELTEFVVDFDAGKLPEFEGEVDQTEVARLSSLAKRAWNIAIANLRTMRSARG